MLLNASSEDGIFLELADSYSTVAGIANKVLEGNSHIGSSALWIRVTLPLLLTCKKAFLTTRQARSSHGSSHFGRFPTMGWWDLAVI